MSANLVALIVQHTPATGISVALVAAGFLAGLYSRRRWIPWTLPEIPVMLGLLLVASEPATYDTPGLALREGLIAAGLVVIAVLIGSVMRARLNRMKRPPGLWGD